MSKQMKFLSFWSINDSLELTSLKKQMRQLQLHGIEGVVFHPRFYPGNPDYLTDAYMKIVNGLILYAKKIGMEFWIYDENGWPSGAASGEVLKKHPDSVVEWVEMLPKTKTPAGSTIIAAHGDYNLVLFRHSGINAMNRDTTDTFIALTHQKYKDCLSKQAFDYVTGFFTDEVSFADGQNVNGGGLPWCGCLAETYLKKYGEPVIDTLWKVFIDSEGSETARVRFWETATEILADNFYKPYEEWCTTNGKLFTGHLKGEETPYFQLPYSGSCFAQLKHVTLPAIDTLERYAGNHFFPYIVDSIAKQQGFPGALAEAMGGAGWGVAPEHLRDYMLWLAESGIDRAVLHLAQYKLIANGIRDWPPSIPLHVNWHQGYADVLNSIRSEAKPLLDAMEKAEKILIVTPTRGTTAAFSPWEMLQVNQHNGTNMPNSKAAAITNDFMETVERFYQSGVKYHFTEECEFAKAKMKHGKLFIGRYGYEKIYIPKSCVFTNDEQAIVDELAANHMLIAAPGNAVSQPEKSLKEVHVPAQSAWKIAAPKSNQLFLPLTEGNDGKLHASFENEGFEGVCILEISDSVMEVSTNGQFISGEDKNTKFVLPHQTGRTELVITPKDERRPFAFVTGNFAVQSHSGFADFDGLQQCSKYNFAVVPKKRLHEGNLLSQGLPFFGGLISASKELHLESRLSGRLTFDGLQAIAARVTVDGEEVGWWWKGHPVAISLAKGKHTLKIECAQSTFNIFGPHRYYLGDYLLTCGLHFEGIKNFADAIDAPDPTFTDDWKFVNFAIAGEVLIEK